VGVVVLPNGQRAVTYTHQSQTGHGDHREANVHIDKIIAKTKHLQDSMHTLEEFVRRNRSLFPEDIIIYQNVKFFRLNEDELSRIGERPDAEVVESKPALSAQNFIFAEKLRIFLLALSWHTYSTNKHRELIQMQLSYRY